MARAVFEHLIAVHSCPRVMVTDNASNFCGEVMTALRDLFNIQHIRTVAYTQGPQHTLKPKGGFGFFRVFLVCGEDFRPRGGWQPT